MIMDRIRVTLKKKNNADWRSKLVQAVFSVIGTSVGPATEHFHFKLEVEHCFLIPKHKRSKSVKALKNQQCSEHLLLVNCWQAYFYHQSRTLV